MPVCVHKNSAANQKNFGRSKKSYMAFNCKKSF